ncbi:Calcium-binding ef-hand [Thalictrum thalictroides]|uniref:Calcium-binding ef-hand n=1 Tax=Thalictrum thalictroides TaxID=46969 RepID=A0A7J6UXC7_THATH|nr:Calcium-binding ef-hand [Thalictrum thalictroides]
MGKITLFILILFLVVDIGCSRLITSRNDTSDSYLVSDGLNDVYDQSTYLLLNPITSTVVCEPMYGFLPCAPNIWGHLFLIVVYQYLLYLGDCYVSNGSELMFSLLGPGIFGASAFQILGVLPQVLLSLASGISGSNETAQAQVADGLGMLTGSTVFLLTLLWGTCVVVGNVDLLEDLTSFDAKATKRLSILESGVTTDLQTKITARIMILSTIPFIIAQLPFALGFSGGRIATLIALIISFTFLFLYCFYQIFQPWIQNRRLEYLMHRFVEDILLQKLFTRGGKPNEPIIKELFHKIDKNNDAHITPPELKGLILGIQFQEVGLNEEDFVEMVMKEFDCSEDHLIDEKEFIRGISNWISDTKTSNDKKTRRTWKLDNDSNEETEEEQDLLMKEPNVQLPKNNPFWSYVKAASLLALGTCILLLLASPLTSTVVNLSSAANIPSIYISFILVPIVVNYRRAIAAISSILQRREQSASLTLSEIYSAAFMNNIVGMFTTLVTMYARGLEWNFSAEVLVVLMEVKKQLKSDGGNDVHEQCTYLLSNPITSAVACEPMYGFLPCAPNIWGHLFLIVVYQYLLYLGERYVSNGSELMFRVLGPGIFGASAFQILGVLPQVILSLASGISGSKETAQDQVAGGLGMLAGSTVFLVTLLWGTCVLVGDVDLFVDLTSFKTKAANPLSSLGSGVTTDLQTCYTARIMILSTIPFIIPQLPYALGFSGGRIATLIALMISFAILFLYCFYQVFQPWIQTRRLEYLMHKFVEDILLQKLFTRGGKPNEAVIRELFHKFDKDKDNLITPRELKGLILGIQFQEVGLNEENFVEMILKEFDFSEDHLIDEKEFVRGISNWISDTKASNDKKIRRRWKLDKNSNEETEEEQHLLMKKENTKVKLVINSFWSYLKPTSLLVLGTCILLLLAGPLTSTVVNISSAANIPSVYISFILVPLVVNYRMAVGAINTILQRKEQSASLTLSMIYSAAFMNNIVGIFTTLGTVYIRGLEWNYSAEVLVVVMTMNISATTSTYITTETSKTMHQLLFMEDNKLYGVGNLESQQGKLDFVHLMFDEIPL